MGEMKLTFKTPNEIVEFVNTVSKYEFDIDVRRGRVVVDAKSLLGIMHLGLNSVLELKMHSGDCQELEAGTSEICSIILESILKSEHRKTGCLSQKFRCIKGYTGIFCFQATVQPGDWTVTFSDQGEEQKLVKQVQLHYNGYRRTSGRRLKNSEGPWFTGGRR